MTELEQERNDDSTEIEKVAATASQMGHSVTLLDDANGVSIDTLTDDMVSVIDYGHDKSSRYGRFEVRVNNQGQDFDEFDVAFAAVVDELLI